MKKITFLALAFIGSIAFQAQAQEVVMTQNEDDVQVPGGVSCGGGDNAYYRAYDLSNGDQPYSPQVLLVGAEFGVENIDGDDELTVNIYQVSSFPDGFDSTATPDLLASASVTVGLDDVGTVVRVVFDNPPTVDQDAIIAVQLNQGETGLNYFPAVTGGATADSYITSVVCDIVGTPVSYADIGFPDSHTILNLVVDMALGVNDVALSQVSIFPNPAQNVINVNVPGSIEIERVAMYDLLGKRANVSISNGQVNVSELASGVYLMKIETSVGTITEKVIKQ
ncbi:T9SS type A sorting domain-containing protein [Patiriisocius sp. Uisw_017]|jgi:hypothetical protein|uniref:T9SS type A sorting domain-containing protein n=1 Tax=Patiriisocius sp. Uisw_017 TaxID=3230968 RepID=UPI0039EB9DA6